MTITETVSEDLEDGATDMLDGKSKSIKREFENRGSPMSDRTSDLPSGSKPPKSAKLRADGLVDGVLDGVEEDGVTADGTPDGKT